MGKGNFSGEYYFLYPLRSRVSSQNQKPACRMEIRRLVDGAEGLSGRSGPTTNLAPEPWLLANFLSDGVVVSHRLF